MTQRPDSLTRHGEWRLARRAGVPDAGGSHDAMAAVNAARDQALKEIV